MSDISTVCCPVCGAVLKVKFSTSKRGKVSLSLACPNDGRHFRGFINDRTYVDGVLSRLEGHTPLKESEVDPNNGKTPSRRSKTNLERGS